MTRQHPITACTVVYDGRPRCDSIGPTHLSRTAMHNISDHRISHLRIPSLLPVSSITLLAVSLLGCHHTAPMTMAAPIGGRAVSSTERMPGIPNVPDLVTVVPLQLPAAGYPLIPAAVDGRQGMFLLDMGAVGISLNKQHIKVGLHGVLDTVTAGNPTDTAGTTITVHTIRIGTLLAPLGTTLGFPGDPVQSTLDERKADELGNLGKSRSCPLKRSSIMYISASS